MKRNINFLVSTICVVVVFLFASCSNADKSSSTSTSSSSGVTGSAVDLGLSVKWSSINMGGYNCYDSGANYSWGSTRTSNSFNIASCSYCDYNGKIGFGCYWKKYYFEFDADKISTLPIMTQISLKANNANGDVDNIDTLQPVDDAASVNWGSNWRIPTKEEWVELFEECTWSYHAGKSSGSSVDKASYYTVTGPSGASIVIVSDIYWTSEVDEAWSSCAWAVSTYQSKAVNILYERYRGNRIRPVYTK